MTAYEKARAYVSLSVVAAVLVLFAVTGVCRADSLWNMQSGQPSSLYSTTKGEYKIGDIITILIVESIRASNSASLNTDKESDLDVELNGFDRYFGLTNIFGRSIDNDPKVGLDAESGFDSDGSSQRSSTITGTVTGQVTEILPNGNLRIEASQLVAINQEKNAVILMGTIRPADISAQNTVFSTQIANAEIRYAGKGPLSNVQKRGIFKEFLEFIWPF